MAIKQCSNNSPGFSLVELLIIISIVGVLLAIAAPELGGQLRRLHVKDCAQKLAADIRHARASAQSQGHRAQLVIPTNSNLQDFNGDGNNELWLTFLDSYPNPDSSYTAGETVLSCGACSSGIIIEPNPDLTNSLPLSTDGTNRFMWFSMLGTLQSTAIDKSIVITNQGNNSYKVRVKIISLTGNFQIQSCEAAGSVDCSNESDWHDI
jgi:prepilin-type N-terminal cleavage/methylation domain-containing protein